MRTTIPTFQKPLLKLSALILLTFFLTNFIACKSSMEEDLAPAAQEKVIPEMPAATTPVSPAPVDSSTTIVDAGHPITSNQTLRNTFPFPIGTAVVKERLDGATYRDVLLRHFSSITVESSMVFKATHPEQNKWTFQKADAIVNFANQNNIRVHAQTLLYPKDSMMPAWIKQFKGDRAAWQDLLKTHVQTLVNHFKGKVAAWDVVNEAFADNGAFNDNIWLRNIGEDYIILAFKYAHEADPGVPLFLNDYGQEYGGKKMARILDIVAQGKQNNITINLGFQMHTVVRIDVNKIADNLKKAANTGVMVYISELDVSVRYGKADTFLLDNLLAEEQALKYKAIVKAYMNSVPAKQQYGITTWGIGDADSFQNNDYKDDNHDYPLLFDKLYNQKPAYKGFMEAGLGL
jgi:endo-1,4-beta-xylanase